MGAAGAYDFRSALSKLQGLADDLRQRGAAAPGAGGGAAADAPAATRAAAALRLWRANRGSLLALVTLYSIPTAAVTALFFAERQKRSDELRVADQETQLRQQIQSLQGEAEAGRQLLGSFAAELKMLEGSWRPAAARARLAALLQPGGRAADGGSAPEEAAAAASPGVAGPAGLAVGQNLIF
ncbi:hypothetical protein Rsub_02588 [Raphidocelis subcapitata]|uniref:Uncharacterized protein n=1 Tax=Raphidocelis subcapitata TaxID=307507 RepID=A0A2V0NQH9_9CHLO|nr:hypothetical protein Rsub_02588 [Raphidocelis subcapitata]|eukprot:GBF89884.1 hypothetical protein Rsub_02588 [Raphidocelis subcapitata]